MTITAEAVKAAGCLARYDLAHPHRDITFYSSAVLMKISERIARWFVAPELTKKRIWFAFAVAALTDSAQLLLGPLGWAFVDEGLDIIAMILTCALLGFHMLLLPTFVIELVPVADMLPTWTGCTAVVVMLRKRAQPQSPPMPMKMAKVTEPPPGNP